MREELHMFICDCESLQCKRKVSVPKALRARLWNSAPRHSYYYIAPDCPYGGRPDDTVMAEGPKYRVYKKTYYDYVPNIKEHAA